MGWVSLQVVTISHTLVMSRSASVVRLYQSVALMFYDWNADSRDNVCVMIIAVVEAVVILDLSHVTCLN